MASYNELNALIDAYINRNGVQAITGQILNGVLKAMVEQLGRGYTIMGAATPTTDPGTPDGPECYFASETGTYADFDGLQVAPGELALLCYTPSDGWTKATIYEGFQEVGATIDGNVGTPSVGVSYAGGVLSFDFHNMKGNPGQNGQDGQDGAAAGFGTIGADITGGVGTPGVSVESSGPATAKNLQFHFTNLKGETGVTSVVATVDNTTGNPACTVSLVGQQLTLAFSGLKGAQGDTGSSVDYPFTIVNNLTTNDATQALSAAQGVVLDGKVTQLEAKVTNNLSEDSHGGIGSIWYNYPLKAGGKYTITNTGVNGTINVMSASEASSGHVVETFKNSLAIGDSITFAPTIDAPYLQIYYAAVGSFSIVDESSITPRLEMVEDGLEELSLTIEDKLSYTNNAGVGSVFFDYSLKAGKSYTVKNTGVNGTINVMSASEKTSGHVVETFKNGLAVGASVTFTPTVSAPYLQIYFAAIGAFTIVCDDTVDAKIDKLNARVDSTENDIEELQQEVSNLENDFSHDVDVDFTTLSNYLISSEDGSLVSSPGQSYTIINLIDTGYKSITFKTAIYGGNYGYGFVLADNSWTGVRTTSVSTITVAIPEGAKEFRLCWSASQVPSQEITAKQLFSATGVYADIANAKINRLPYPVRFGYELENVPEQTVSPFVPLADYYALYDALVSSYPSWVQKVDCSDADSEISVQRPSYLDGLPIYMYHFSPSRTHTSANTGNKLKIMLVAGTHSNEELGMFLLHRFFLMIENLWRNDNNFAQLRTMVDFYVFPCLNPWGYVYKNSPGQSGVAIPGRANGNGVNLNRNFPTKNWVASGSPTDANSNYTGATPGSEYETQILMYYANLIQPEAIFDIHTGGMTASGAYGSVEIHNGAESEFVAMCLGMARGIINRWIKDNDNFPQGIESSSVLFDVNLSSVVGELHRWAYENITKVSVLTEESFFQGWENGVLNTDTSTQEYNTARIWKENLESLYNTILRITESASIRKYED